MGPYVSLGSCQERSSGTNQLQKSHQIFGTYEKSREMATASSSHFEVMENFFGIFCSGVRNPELPNSDSLPDHLRF